MKTSERGNRLGVQAFGVHTNIDEAVAHLAEESPRRAAGMYLVFRSLA